MMCWKHGFIGCLCFRHALRTGISGYYEMTIEQLTEKTVALCTDLKDVRD